jgi:hypothetical protein
MPADQTRSFHKKRHLGRAAPARDRPTPSAGPHKIQPNQLRSPPRSSALRRRAAGADEPERRESAAATMAWRTVHMSDVPESIVVEKGPEAVFFVHVRTCTFGFQILNPKGGGGSPRKGLQHTKAMPPRPKLGWPRPIGAVADSPSPAHWGVRNISGRAAAPSRAPLRPHSLNAQFRDCTGAAA